MDDTARIIALQAKVGELERKLNFVMDHLKLEYRDDPHSPALAEAANWLKKGNKLEAINAYRHLTRAGLKEAKDAVDALARKLGIE